MDYRDEIETLCFIKVKYVDFETIRNAATLPQPLTAVNHCLLIATYFTDLERMAALVKPSALGVEPVTYCVSAT